MDIAELIRATKGDRSYEALSRDCGGDPTAGRLQQIATQPQKEFPKPPTIAALARGLRVTERAVVMAWAESIGIAGPDMPRIAELLPASASRLADDETAAVLAVVNVLTKKEREGSGRQPAATNPAVSATADPSIRAALDELREQLRQDVEAAATMPHSSAADRAKRARAVADQYIADADRILASRTMPGAERVTDSGAS